MSTTNQLYDPLANGYATGLANIFDGWFGPMRRVQDTDPYEFANHEKFDRPEASRGKTYHLRDTVNDWWLTSKRKFWLTDIAPVFFTDELHVSWSDWDTNAHFLTVTPEEAASRLVTQKYRLRRANLVRRGIGVEFEHGFIKTAQGRASFILAVGQVAQSIVETCHMLVYRALLDCHVFQNVMQKRHGVLADGDLIKMLKRDRNRFGVVQKSKNGMEWINAEIDEEMYRYRGEADTWLLSPDVVNYVRTRRDEKTDYYLAGPRGPQILNGQNAIAAAGDSQGATVSLPDSQISNVPVYIVRAMDLPGIRSTELMSHTRQIGEYFTLFDTVVDSDQYASEARTISVFNSDENRFSRITLLDALNHCNVFDKSSGNVKAFSNGGPGQTTQQNQEDQRNDFLTRMDPNGTPAAVEYVADLSYEFLGADGLTRAGRTLTKQIFEDQELAAVNQRINEAIQSAIEAMERNNVVTIEDIVSSEKDPFKDYAKRVIAKLRQLAPVKGLLIDQFVEGGKDDVTIFMELFVVKNGTPVVPTGLGPKGPTGLGPKGKEEEDDITPLIDLTDYGSGHQDSDSGYQDLYELDDNNDVQNDNNNVQNNKKVKPPKTITIVNGKINLVQADYETTTWDYIENTLTRIKGSLYESKKFGDGGTVYRYYVFGPGTQSPKYGTDDLEDGPWIYLGTVGPSRIFSRIRNAFFSSLVAGVPSSHRETVRGLISDDRSDLENAERIRDHITGLIESKVPGVPWKNVAAMSQWFGRRVDQYKQKQVEAQAQTRKAQKQRRFKKKAPKQSSKVIAWALPGQQLPAGWRYVHASASRHRPLNRVGRIIPNSIEACTLFNTVIHAQKSRAVQPTGYRAPRDASAGMGWSGVGNLQFTGDHMSRKDRYTTPAEGMKHINVRFNNLGHLLKELERQSTSAIDRINAYAYLLLPMNLYALKAMVEQNVMLPLGFIAFKPHIQYKCRMGIKLARGGRAINMAMGKGDLQIEHSAKVKTGVLHWTGYMGAICHAPKNVYVQDSLMTHGYDGGDGMQYWDPSTYIDRNKRRPERDIIIAPVPYTFGKHGTDLSQVIDISGQFHVSAASGLLRREDRQGLHYPSAPRMNAMFRFHDSRSGNDLDMPARRNAIKQNTVCWAGHQFMWNPRRQDFSAYRPNTGHRGKDVYAGMAAVWDGSMAETLEKQTFTGLTSM